jgi:tetratricopeptide (TPR) repeat protein
MTLEHSVTKNPVEEAKLNAALEALEAARELQRMRRSHGVNRIELLVDDVDGDWLEQWGEDEVLDSEEFQEKLDYFVATARKEEFQKDIQKIEEKIAETDQEIQDFKAKFISKIQRAYQDLPAAIPIHLLHRVSSENLLELPLALTKNIEVITNLSNLVAFQPTAEDHFRLGNARFLEGQYEDAIISFEKALELKTNYHEALINRGVSLRYLGRDKEAVSSYDTVIKQNNDDYIAWYNRSASLIKLGHYKEALISCERAIELKPDLAESWSNRCNLFNKLGHHEEAIRSCDTALELKTDLYGAWINRGDAFSSLKLYKEAIQNYDKALILESSCYVGWDARGVALSKLGHYEEAITSHAKALKIKPDYANAWFNKACVYALQDNLDQTIENLTRAIKLDPIYREQAKTDSDFDLVRREERFKKLLED